MVSLATTSLILVSIASTVHGQSASQPSNRPTGRDWARLNTTLGGRLSPGIPWSKPCFTSYNGQPSTPDAAECAYVEANFFDNHLNRSQAFAGYGSTNFEGCMATGEQCELDYENPLNPDAFSPPADCKQGSIPDYFIDVKGKDDVIAAFQFVKATKVPLVIKNSGHDFKGRSSAPGSLALWTHNLKYIAYNPEFVAEGCKTPQSPQMAVTFGAGQQFQEIYQFASDNGIIVVGGSDQSVGAAGGWGPGGGHSSLSPTYGMGADRTLQYKVVTVDGVYRTVNACQHQDLFYALRGGGGGTFAVVLEATVMAAPATSFRVVNINWPINNANHRQILSVFLENITTWATQSWGGYLTPTEGNLILTTSKLNVTEAQKATEAISAKAIALGGTAVLSEVPEYLDWFKGWIQGYSGKQDVVGTPIAIASRLIPAKNHATAKSRAELLDALTFAIENCFFPQIHITTPYGFKATDPENTSVNPAWRTALYQIANVNSWPWNATLAEKQAAYEGLTRSVAPLRKITADSGAYHNEADIHEPNWQTAFWGKEYNKLLAIKNKYDPDRILDCWHCVGWTGASNPRYKCYI